MSQTETLMVLALGAALTCVVFLLFGRVFWSMAMAAGARRRAKDVPVALLELQADRDRLRAEHALMARKLELRVEDIKTRMAEQMAEVSRNRNRVQSLAQEVARKDELIASKEQEIAALTTQLDVAKAQLSAAHQTVANLGDESKRHDQEMLTLQEAFRKLGTSLREKNALVGNLNEELRAKLAAEWPAMAPAAEGAPLDIDARLRQRVAQLTSISADMSREANILPLAPTDATEAERPTGFSAEELNRKVAETERLSEEMEAELKQLDQLLAPAPADEALAIAPETEPQRKQGAMANVVSLAQRIRALQHGMND